VAETKYVSNFNMLHHLIEDNQPLVSMVVSQLWAKWRHVNSERVTIVHKLCLDEWSSKIDLLLKFTSLTFELL
jgi:hypothetical protein